MIELHIMRRIITAINALNTATSAILMENAHSVMNQHNWYPKQANVPVWISKELLFTLKIVWYRSTFTIWIGERITLTYLIIQRRLIAQTFSISPQTITKMTFLACIVMHIREKTRRITLLMRDSISLTWQRTWFTLYQTILLICMWIPTPIADSVKPLIKWISR